MTLNMINMKMKGQQNKYIHVEGKQYCTFRMPINCHELLKHSINCLNSLKQTFAL